MVEKNKMFQLFANLFMCILCVLCILPFMLLFASSLTNERTLIQDGYRFFTTKIDFAAYKYIFVDTDSILRGYGVSVLVTVVGTVTNLVITTLFAYPLSMKELPGRRFLSFFLFFTMLFNGGLIPTYIMWTQFFKIKNTIWALLIPNLLMGAFYVIMLRTYFTSSIPGETIDAARIDGASEVRILGKIVLPMSKPILSTLALFVGLNYWNDWVNGLYYVTDPDLYTIQMILNTMINNIRFLSTSAGSMGVDVAAMNLPSVGIRMGIAVVAVIPILCIYPFLQKYFVKGIVVGGVKG